jgi:hypothetical protein
MHHKDRLIYEVADVLTHGVPPEPVGVEVHAEVVEVGVRMGYPAGITRGDHPGVSIDRPLWLTSAMGRSVVTMDWMPRAEEAMTDQQPVEPDAILDRGGAAVPYRRTGDNAAPLASHTLIPMLARMATAGPVLTASAFAISALAAAKAVEMAGRMAWHLAGGPVAGGSGTQAVPGRLEVTWTRVEIRWPS